MGCEDRNPPKGKAGEARAPCESEEGESIPESQAPLSLRLPPPPLFCWGSHAGSNGTACFKGLLPSTSLLFVSWDESLERVVIHKGTALA